MAANHTKPETKAVHRTPKEPGDDKNSTSEEHVSNKTTQPSGWDRSQWQTAAWTLGVCVLGLFIWAGSSAQSTADQEAPKATSESAPPADSESSVPVAPDPVVTPKTQPSYGSYECTDDCSGHDAGYQWAEDNQICDEYYSDGNSDSFNEGVQAWASDNCGSYDDEAESDDEYSDWSY